MKTTLNDAEIIELIRAYMNLRKENKQLNNDLNRAYEIIERVSRECKP